MLPVLISIFTELTCCVNFVLIEDHGLLVACKFHSVVVLSSRLDGDNNLYIVN